jgi:hypothetical protein
VYERCQLLKDELSTRVGELAELRKAKRESEAIQVDLEFELMSQEAANHSDFSQAALDRHMKMFFSKDSTHREIRKLIREKQARIDEVEGIKAVLEADIRIECSRMSELGGYLQYLAAVKMAQPKAA